VKSVGDVSVGVAVSKTDENISFSLSENCSVSVKIVGRHGADEPPYFTVCDGMNGFSNQFRSLVFCQVAESSRS